MPGKPWTAADDELVRQFHAEGWKDADVAYIMGRNHSLVARKRKALDLPPNGKPGPVKGTYRMPDDIRLKIRDLQVKRWREDAEYSHACRVALRKANEAYQATRWRMPTDPDLLAYYKKIRQAYGAKEARKLLEQLTTATALRAA